MSSSNEGGERERERERAARYWVKKGNNRRKQTLAESRKIENE